MDLEQFFREHPKAALAFSGGADSAYLLYAAVKCGAQVRPYYAKTAFQPRFEYEDARRLARELGVELVTIPLDVLGEPAITANSANRCYFCKQKIFTSIQNAARADGFDLLLDGTNASDQVTDRPGMKALQELSVLSPLRLCGLTKPEIRRRSKEAGLFTHDKPAYACLATRIPTGKTITAGDLERTEACEAFLMQLGFSGFRIRLLGDRARLELPESQLPKLLEQREKVLAALKKYYSGVLLDLEVRDEQ
ncbi:MAG: ATP-dependent sacrificial sulfur transferase LarE [Faecousia sp.]